MPYLMSIFGRYGHMKAIVVGATTYLLPLMEPYTKKLSVRPCVGTPTWTKMMTTNITVQANLATATGLPLKCSQVYGRGQ